jgi:hypothetical protein
MMHWLLDRRLCHQGQPIARCVLADCHFPALLEAFTAVAASCQTGTILFYFVGPVHSKGLALSDGKYLTVDDLNWLRGDVSLLLAIDTTDDADTDKLRSGGDVRVVVGKGYGGDLLARQLLEDTASYIIR